MSNSCKKNWRRVFARLPERLVRFLFSGINDAGKINFREAERNFFQVMFVPQYDQVKMTQLLGLPVKNSVYQLCIS
ncbi:MAG: hypothetical protein CL536_06640 [Alcaligenaceae bacterium]|nr:hypothetical protein [Alcaligenaceae bacterium]